MAARAASAKQAYRNEDPADAAEAIELPRKADPSILVVKPKAA